MIAIPERAPDGGIGFKREVASEIHRDVARHDHLTGPPVGVDVVHRDASKPSANRALDIANRWRGLRLRIHFANDMEPRGLHAAIPLVAARSDPVPGPLVRS